MSILANAKLNLMLRIVGKREDGYHLLKMINVPIDLYDEVDLKIKETKAQSLLQSFSVPLDCSMEKTTIYKAYQLLKRHIPEFCELSVHITKKIPMGSGLGGGSSDAAFFIKEICKSFDINITETLLAEVANTVGADVPFFLFNVPAVVEGIGEKVIPLKRFPRLYFVVVVPDFAVSTKWAYENVKMPLTNKVDDINIKNSEIDLRTLLGIMENDLEEPVTERYPAIKEIEGALIRQGALKAMMTGSGSAVFGIFDTVDVWERAFEAIKKSFSSFQVIKCKTIGV